MRIEIMLLPLTWAVLVPPSSAAETPATRTLAECIAIAIEQHPSLKAASASVEAGHQRVWEAGSNYLPQIKASYTADKRNTSTANRLGIPSASVNVPAPTPGGTPGPSASNIGGTAQTFNFYQTGFGLQQMLFDWGQNLNAIRSAQASERSLQADQSTQRDTVVLNVKQSYFNLLATRRLLAVADETVRQNQKHLEQAQGRYDVGLAAKFDVTQARVQVANAQLNQVTARNNVAVARETLRNALGLTGPLDFDIIDTFDLHAVQITEEEALGAAYDRRPELRSIRAQQIATTEQVAALQKNYLPIITATGNYQWSGSTYPLQSSWDIGAAVNLSIFNGGLTTAQVAEQKAILANLKYNEEVERQNIALEVRQDTLNLQQAVESIRVSEEALQQARENLDLAEGRYKTGVGNIIELTDAQASLTSAEASHVQALYNYKTAVAALEKATAQQLTTE
jgi:outer membrane protein